MSAEKEIWERHFQIRLIELGFTLKAAEIETEAFDIDYDEDPRESAEEVRDCYSTE